LRVHREVYILDQDQWDIYKLDPTYECRIYPDSMPTISPAHVSPEEIVEPLSQSQSQSQPQHTAEVTEGTSQESPSKPKRRMSPPLSARKFEDAEPKKRHRPAAAPVLTNASSSEDEWSDGDSMQVDSPPRARSRSQSVRPNNRRAKMEEERKRRRELNAKKTRANEDPMAELFGSASAMPPPPSPTRTPLFAHHSSANSAFSPAPQIGKRKGSSLTPIFGTAMLKRLH
jgi:hypothetical protein